MKLKTSKFKVLDFEGRQDIMTKFKSQALYIIRIKYWKDSGSSNSPSLIPALRKITILGLKTIFSILFCTRLYKIWKSYLFSTATVHIGLVKNQKSNKTINFHFSNFLNAGTVYQTLKAASLFCLRSNLPRVGGRYTVGPFSTKSLLSKNKGLPHCPSILVL